MTGSVTNSKSARVVVTGLGAVAPNGPDTASFWNSLLDGVSGIRKIRSFDVSGYPCQVGGEALDFKPEEFVETRTLRRTGRTAHLAVASVLMALRDSGLENIFSGAQGAAVIYGMGCPPIDVIAQDVGLFLKEGARRLEPYKLSAEDSNSVVTAITESIGASSTAIVVSTGCTAGLNAIGLAFDKVRTGQATTVVCGSADAPLSPFSYAVFCASGIMSKRNSHPQKASRPFDLRRDGGVLSEGAGTLILESLETALARGARIYGEILGFASITQAGRNQRQSPEAAAREGFIRSMGLAMSDAKILAEDVDYISAHAPSDPILDRIETEAIKAVFGSWAYRVPVSSIKSCIGNPVAAIGALQTIATLLAIRDDKVPPTINYEYPDSTCDLDCVPNHWRHNRVDVALINSHGMGGTYSSLVIGRCEGSQRSNQNQPWSTDFGE